MYPCLSITITIIITICPSVRRLVSPSNFVTFFRKAERCRASCNRVIKQDIRIDTAPKINPSGTPSIIRTRRTCSVGSAKCICGLALFASGGKPAPVTEDDDDDDDDDADDEDDDDEDDEEYGLSRL